MYDYYIVMKFMFLITKLFYYLFIVYASLTFLLSSRYTTSYNHTLSVNGDALMGLDFGLVCLNRSRVYPPVFSLGFFFM
jgi:hypothetical protein